MSRPTIVGARERAYGDAHGSPLYKIETHWPQRSRCIPPNGSDRLLQRPEGVIPPGRFSRIGDYSRPG
jgi:hypothetical protein